MRKTSALHFDWDMIMLITVVVCDWRCHAIRLPLIHAYNEAIYVDCIKLNSYLDIFVCLRCDNSNVSRKFVLRDSATDFIEACLGCRLAYISHIVYGRLCIAYSRHFSWTAAIEVTSLDMVNCAHSFLIKIRRVNRGCVRFIWSKNSIWEERKYGGTGRNVSLLLTSSRFNAGTSAERLRTESLIKLISM